MKNANESQRIKKLTEKANSILIASHSNPDPDAVGSLLALKSVFENQGKKVVVYLPDAPSKSLSFLAGFSQIVTQLSHFDFDLFVCVDYGSFSRLGLPDNISPEKIVTIDHHDGLHKGAVQLIKPEAASTTEVIYELLKDWKVKIDEEIANALLVGLIGDTGFFTNSSTSAKAFKMAAELLSKGANMGVMNEFSIYFKDPSFFDLKNLLGEVLKRASLEEKIGLAYSYFSFSELKEKDQIQEAMYLTGFVPSLLASVDQAKIGLLLVEYERGRVRGSLRSKRGIKVNIIAQSLGGGGHPYAAGFKTLGSIEDILRKVKEMLK